MCAADGLSADGTMKRTQNTSKVLLFRYFLQKVFLIYLDSFFQKVNKWCDSFFSASISFRPVRALPQGYYVYLYI